MMLLYGDVPVYSSFVNNYLFELLLPLECVESATITVKIQLYFSSLVSDLLQFLSPLISNKIGEVVRGKSSRDLG